MITVELRGDIGFAGLEDGGKAMRIYHEPSETEYIIGLPPEAIEPIVRDLTMDNDKLAQRIADEARGKV